MLPGFEDREIFPGPRDVPEDVFCFAQVDTWRGHVWSMLDDLITDDVKALFVADPPEYVVSDDLSWLDDLIFRASGQDTNIKEEAAWRLRQRYRAFRAAHATRTNDLSQFYSRGLRYLRPEEIEDRARTLLLNGQAEGASEAIIRAAIPIRAAWQSSARKILKGLGRPTLFICDVPMKLISDRTIEEFAGMMLEYLFCELVEHLEAHSLSPGAPKFISKIDKCLI
jgi:hypothetical protein